MKVDQVYDPTEVESGWYEFWTEKGYFRADETSEKEPYTIVIPPPNVTGSLHMGHALFVTLQDLLIRWKRMEGFEALWLPGVDHAGIATQVMVERQLAKEGTDRHELGREKFLERVWAWKEQHGGRIIEQLKHMGASCDWERERFTLDEGLSRSVREAFVRLYEEGLIYRAERMVDWDPVGQTVLSDLEVDREEETGKFWYLRYPLADGSGHIVVGTTRPETMLGDTAVAVHPDDERYQEMIGKMVKLPIVGTEIPIVADDVLPDPEKGTGAVKVTPAHDPNDFECGKRHDLALIQVIGFDATMTDNAPEEFRGLDRYEARKLVIKRFEELGLLEKIEDRPFAPGRSSRTGVIVEPLPMLQWFVKGKPLADPAIEAVESGKTELIPPVWKKTYDHFMYNIRDWCISRQLWWGHQIPAWYCDSCGNTMVLREDPTACTSCGSTEFKRDEDVLDTWFSSALWPFSTLGWPDDTTSLQKFYPTQVMETGFDILFFWVARMMMMGIHFMDEVPFEKVFLHAMVRDAAGRKMSKTYGNVIDPLHMIYGAKAEELDPEMHAELLRQYPEGVGPQGADALRFTLAIYAAQGRDIKLDIRRIEGYRAFLNKLWNAARFTLMNLEGFEAPAYGTHTEAWDGAATPVAFDDLSVADRWILSRLDETVVEVKSAFDEFRFNDAAQTLYHFVWHGFCDWYIELVKPMLYDDSSENASKRTAAQGTLNFVLETTLRLLHPIAPYITEDIWQALPKGADAMESIMIAPFPTSRPELAEMSDAVATMELHIGLINSIRAIRGETNVKPSAVIETLYLVSDEATHRERLEAGLGYIRRLGKVDNIEIIGRGEAEGIENAATAVSDGVEIRIPLLGLIDIDEELARLNKELARVDEDITFVSRKLANEGFVAKAPPAVVQKEREKLVAYEDERVALMASLQELEALKG